MITYSITPESPEAHLYRVVIDIPNPSADGQKLQLPAWIPGSYMIRDFAKHVVTIEGSCDGLAVGLSKLDKQTWQFAPCSGGLKVCYQIYAWDLSVRGAHLDTTHAYFNGTSVFLKVVGQEWNPCHVSIQFPSGEDFQSWKIATTLKALAEGQYMVGSYDELIDHPVEMGHFDACSFEVEGVLHEVVLTGAHDADMNRLASDLKSICSTQAGMFGGLPDMEKYQFQVLVVGDGYGGLEHRSSTSLICSRKDLPYQGMDGITEEYRRFLGLCSHEYFHLWNVKRIRPKVLAESDLTTECYTKLLWLFEGFTSYYDDMFLLRSGLIEQNSYLELLAANITQVSRGTGSQKQTVEESSFDAWTKFYKQDENAPNAIVSYYTKGALIALCIDLTLRKNTNGEKNLDDVMRMLWQKFGSQGIGLEEDDAESLISEIAGFDMSSRFDRWLRSTDALPLQSLLAEYGVGLRLRQARSAQDRGGVIKEGVEQIKQRFVIGASWRDEPLGVRLQQVYEGGAAQLAGLAAGDHLIAINGLSVNGSELEQLIQRNSDSKSLAVHAFRRDELMQFSLLPQLAPEDTGELWLQKEVSSVVESRRVDWLGECESNGVNNE